MKKLFAALLASSLCLIATAQTPGGVSGSLVFWMKSNATNNILSGGSVSSWQNQVLSGVNNATLASANAAALNTSSNLLNYNSSARFNGPGATSGDIRYETSNLQITGESTVFFVLTHRDQVAGGSVFRPILAPISFTYSAGFNNPGYCLGLFRGANWFYGGVPEAGGVAEMSASSITTNFQHISTVRSNLSPLSFTYDIDGCFNNFRNGYFLSPSFTIGYQIGGNTFNSNRYIDTDFGELIIYNRSLTPTEKLKAESYLAIKYGITLKRDFDNDNIFGEVVGFGSFSEGDYMATDGTIVWEANVQPIYHSDVIGIGRDDSEGLLQKQSHSLDDTSRIYLDVLQVNNQSNSGSFSSDISYITMGHNRDKVFNVTLPATELPTGLGLYSRLEREWKVVKTNVVEDFNWDVTIPIGALPGSVDPGDLRVLIDDDGDFSNGGTSSYFNGDGSGVVLSYAAPIISVANISQGMIPNNQTRYMTIASVSPSTPLPIELMEFSAECMNNRPVVRWKTSTELNNDYFSVERSSDLKVFETVGEIGGAGNSNSEMSYSFLDTNPISGTVYYRLSQTDFNGETTIHAVKSLMCEAEEVQVLIYPTFFDNTFAISTNRKGSLTLFNQLGQVVVEQPIEVGESEIDGRNIAAGSYIAKFTMDNGDYEILKLVKH